MAELKKFVEWLSFHPPVEYIARSIVIENLSTYHAVRCQISRLRTDDSLVVLSSFGPEAEEQGHVSSGTEWRQWCQENLVVATQDFEMGPWSKDGAELVLPMRDRGTIQGFVHVVFANPISEPVSNDVVKKSSEYATALALYFSLLPGLASPAGARKEARDSAPQGPADPSALTPRQLKILAGMVEAKTNHEMAEELGFSVSTVRQETMAIYKALGVLDRRAAAARAMELNLA